MYARVVVDIKHQHVNTYFDYQIPPRFAGFLERGMRVIVPFGEQRRLGFVIETMAESQAATRMIEDVLDVVPTLNEESFIMVDALLETRPTLHSSAIETVLPKELLVSYAKEVRLIKPAEVDDDLLLFFNRNQRWQLKKSDQVHAGRIKRMSDKGIVAIDTVIREKATRKVETLYRFNPHHQYAKIEQYLHVVDLFETETAINRKTLLESGISVSTINTLVKHDVLMPSEHDVFREPEHVFDKTDKRVNLNDEQLQAVRTVLRTTNNQTHLLYGVTGSGKTEVYLDLIAAIIEQGRQVLIMVPEIAQIAPLAQRLKARFDKVAIFHSALSTGERTDQYRMIFNQHADIVLGTRSAVFLPMSSLGLVIIDEEHDDAYVQREGVWYDARALAGIRARYHDIPLLRGSATPSIESMHLAKQGTYNLLVLSQRPSGLTLPNIILVDMKAELKAGHTSIFSRMLIDKIKDRLSRKEQTILLYNRKGYAPYLLCRQCGHVPTCPSCDIALTYYHDKQYVKCTYCGHEQPHQETCASCESQAVKPVGIGIEYVEASLHKMLPEARVMRMDKDMTTTKGSHERLWQAFKSEHADILIGTQMVAKGLDFPKVTLSVILMADISFRVPSYRADEDAYVLFAQMTGRSGRFFPGEAIIQGYQLDHHAIRHVIEGYDAFYADTIVKRRQAGYPPFVNIAHILFEGEGYLKTYQRAFQLKKMLAVEGHDVLGPTPAILPKLRHRYRFLVTLKYETIDKHALFDILGMLDDQDVRVRYHPDLDLV